MHGAKAKAEAATASLTTAVSESDGLKQANQKQSDRIKQLTGKLADAQSTNTRGVMILSILIAAAGVGLIVYGQPVLGGAVMAAGIAGVVLAVVVSKFAMFIGIGAGVLLLAVIGYMAYQLFRAEEIDQRTGADDGIDEAVVVSRVTDSDVRRRCTAW